MEFHDVTWGTTLTVYADSKKNEGGVDFYKLGAFDLVHPIGCEASIIPRQNDPGLLRLLFHLLKKLPEIIQPDEDEYWVDPAGGVHHRDEVDPTSMYE